jgi:hypothetical protein
MSIDNEDHAIRWMPWWTYGCMQNICMNFVVYWCIFLHIIMLLVVIIMFYNVLWGFSINPPYFGYNSVGQENSVLRILSFRDLPRLKLAWDFWSVNILSRETPEEEEVNEMRPRGRWVQVAWAPCQAALPMLIGASSLRCRPSSLLDAQLDLKKPIYTP